MIKGSKRDLILDSIIQAYLNDNLPIGSHELGSRMSVSIPASTIRVYFKKLSDEGAITQLHVSGGRIPTIATMNAYWQSRLDFDNDFNVEDERLFKMLVQNLEIYCMIYGDKEQNLEEIYNLHDKFLILNFTDDELVLKFDRRAHRFLENLIGASLNKLETIAIQVGFSELRNKIKELKRGKICFQQNEEIALKIFGDGRFKMILDPSFERLMSSNLAFAPLFEDSFMGIKCGLNFKGKRAKMICAGSVYTDYEKFFNHIKDVA